MAVQLSEIRDLLLPGLREVTSMYEMCPLQWSFAETKEIVAADIFNRGVLPKVSLPVAVAMGVAAAVIKNPVVSRRWWSWKS